MGIASEPVVLQHGGFFFLLFFLLGRGGVGLSFTFPGKSIEKFGKEKYDDKRIPQTPYSESDTVKNGDMCGVTAADDENERPDKWDGLEYYGKDVQAQRDDDYEDKSPPRKTYNIQRKQDEESRGDDKQRDAPIRQAFTETFH